MKKAWESKVSIGEKETQLKNELSRIFDKEIKDVSSEYQSLGFSGGTFKTSIKFQDESSREVIIKKVGEPEREHGFHTEVLAKIDTKHPKCFGVINLEDSSFIVLDYIPSQEVEYKDNQKYRDAINWLIQKDLAVISNKEILNHSSVESKFHNVYDAKFLGRLDTVIEKNLQESVNQDFKQMLESKADRFLSLNETLMQSPQTINHNDFQMNNILFKQEDGSIVVIDWTHPNQGSVLVDLIALVQTAPREIRSELVEQYKEKINFENFDELYETARIRKNIGVFGWMLQVYIEGQQDQLYMPDFEEFRDSLINF